jgi:hypothetical protein
LCASKHAKSGGKRLIHPHDRPKLITAVIVEQINKRPGRGGKIDIKQLED